MLFNDDVIVLAGATGRVGGATLRHLHAEGAWIVVVSRSADSAAASVAGLERASTAIADLNDPAAVESVVADAVARFGRIDATINLAGRGKFVSLVDSTLDDLRVNVDGFVIPAYNLAIAALRQMLAQEYRSQRRSRGHIVTVTAGSSKDPQPRFGLFGAAKAAVNTLMLAIAQSTRPTALSQTPSFSARSQPRPHASTSMRKTLRRLPRPKRSHACWRFWRAPIPTASTASWSISTPEKPTEKCEWYVGVAPVRMRRRLAARAARARIADGGRRRSCRCRSGGRRSARRPFAVFIGGPR